MAKARKKPTAKKTGRYNYRSPEHRAWALGVKADGNGCYVCGRGKAPRRKGQRLHSHHLHGTGCECGLVLCPTCHDIVTKLTAYGGKVWQSRAMMKRLRWVINERLRGHVEVSESDNDTTS